MAIALWASGRFKLRCSLLYIMVLQSYQYSPSSYHPVLLQDFIYGTGLLQNKFVEVPFLLLFCIVPEGALHMQFHRSCEMPAYVRKSP
jgi:hypothetical protein